MALGRACSLLIVGLLLFQAFPTPTVKAQSLADCLGEFGQPGSALGGLLGSKGLNPPLPRGQTLRQLCNAAGDAANGGGGGGSYGSSGEYDGDRDGLGNLFENEWGPRDSDAHDPLTDIDGDGLDNLGEFRWQLVPLCFGVVTHCKDRDTDAWQDGPEVSYWNNPNNDAALIFNDASGFQISLYDPDRALDRDQDGVANVRDADADNDGLHDGAEAQTYGTYPEFLDSDCTASATTCTSPADTTYHATNRVGAPGTGDGIQDNTERQAWINLRGTNGWSLDHDQDGIPNLRDGDSDNDGLQDGPEFQTQQVRPDDADTENDGVPDGQEPQWNQDTDSDGLLNANDPDSDNDGMPDAWEWTNAFNPISSADAAQDRDEDGLSNVGEYQAGTNPSDMDTENDLLLDGPEVHAYGTNPLFWDSDADAMPDGWEVQHGLQPTLNDAAQDPDADSYDLNGDGTKETNWNNLAEYRYNRPATWTEATDGPWLSGTYPDDPDTDNDGPMDGTEVFFLQNPTSSNNGGDVDGDTDGLTWNEEEAEGTSDVDADADGDRLCDGGRSPSCTRPDGTGAGLPGERDYGTNPRDTDTDHDNLTDGQEATLWDPGATGLASDVDRDGAHGLLDPDNDADNLKDGDEVHRYGTKPEQADTDADGLHDGDEVLVHHTNATDTDSDDDELLDGDEVHRFGTRPDRADTDGDELTDGAEVLRHLTDPTRADTDNDGMPDGWEVNQRTDPRRQDAQEDPDQDRLPHLSEYRNGTVPLDSDTDDDQLLDGWEVLFGLDPLNPLDGIFDSDWDDLENVPELRWGLVPKCLPALFLNCQDHEQDPLTGQNGDLWRDGDEVTYWNDPANDLLLDLDPTRLGQDADASLDTDGDGRRNLDDRDSDNDGLLDGWEARVLGTYPEFADSDCATTATDCTPATNTTSRFDARAGNPGVGDGILDGAEWTAWENLGNLSWWLDWDHDGLEHNLLDPDSDGDGVQDGPELACWTTTPPTAGCSRADRWDTDRDGLLDGPDTFLTSSDPRYGLFSQSRVVYLDSGAGRTFRGEVTAHTNPLVADSDGDGMPDGWEVHHGLNSLDPTDAGIDGDSDSYNPDGTVQPELVWANLDEYRYMIPTTWSVPINGVWWDGTDPNAADTDGDLIEDGVEVAFASDPRDPSSVEPGSFGANPGPGGAQLEDAFKNDPNNKNLPEDEMSPINLQYLREGRVDAAGYANETVTVVDQLVSAAIAGNVSQALNVLYDHVPVEEPVREMSELIELSEEAALAIVRCGSDRIQGPANTTVSELENAQMLPHSNLSQPQNVLGNLSATADRTNATLANITASDPALVVDDTFGCVTSTLVPFLEALVQRAWIPLPIVDPLLAQLRDEELPFLVETADRIVPGDLAATEEALLDRPVSALNEYALEAVDQVSDPLFVDQTLDATSAAADILLAHLVKPTNRHPQLLHDLAVGQGLESAWQQMAEANEEASGASGGKVDAIATIDSLSYNLYTHRSGTERITPILADARDHCVQLDDSTATRDPSGCDLYIRFTASEPSPLTVGPPAPGSRLTPTIQIRPALAGASFELEAIAYLQLPNTPYLVAMGYATRGQGLPTSWEATLQGLDTWGSSDRHVSVLLGHTSPLNAYGLDVVAAGFEVDENQEGKPVVSDNETILVLSSADLPRRLAVHVGEPGPQVRWVLDASESGPVDVLFKDRIGLREARGWLSLQDVGAGVTTITSEHRGPNGLSWTWQAPGPTGRVDASYRSSLGPTSLKAFQINATQLGPRLSLDANVTTHRHRFEAPEGAAWMRFLVAQNQATCRAAATVGDHALFERRDNGFCASGELTQPRSLLLEPAGASARVQGQRGIASTSPVRLVAVESNRLAFELPQAPLSWDAQLSLVANTTEDLSWTASQAVDSLSFDASMRNLGAPHTLRARLLDVPVQVDATLDTATGLGQVTAPDYVGSIDLGVSTTGSAPTNPLLPGTDYARIKFPSGSAGRAVESAWRVKEVKDVSVEPLGDGSVSIRGHVNTPRPLSVAYDDGRLKLRLDASSVAGSFEYVLSQDPTGGRVTIEQRQGIASPSLTLTAGLPKGVVSLRVRDAPPTWSVAANPLNGSVDVEGAAPLGWIDLRYASKGSAPSIARSQGFLVMRSDPATDAYGISLNMSGVRQFHVARLGSTLTISGSAAANSFVVRQQTPAEELDVLLPFVPSLARLTFEPGHLNWTASSPAAFQSLSATVGGSRHTRVETLGAPSGFDLVWPRQYTSAFNATVSHGSASWSMLRVQESIRPGAQSAGGWRLSVTDIPPRVHLDVDAGRGRAAIHPQAPIGVATLGSFDWGFATQRATIPVLTGAGVKLQQSDAGATGSVWLQGLRGLDAELLFDSATSTVARRVQLAQASASSLTLRAASSTLDADTSIVLQSAPSTVEVTVARGASLGDGLQITGSASAAYAALQARLVGPGVDVAFETPATPSEFLVSWNQGAPLRVDANAVFSPLVQAADDLGNAPWPGLTKDYVAVRTRAEDGTVARFGLHLSSVQSFTLDPINRRLDRQGSASPLPLLVDYAHGSTRLGMDVSPAAPTWTLVWDPSLRSFEHNASASMSLVRWAHQPPNGAGPRMIVALESVPAGATRLLVQPQGSLEFQAPSDLGTVRLGFDQGGQEPLHTSQEQGVFVDDVSSQRPLRVTLSGVRDLEAEWAASKPAFLEITGGSSGPLRASLAGGGVLATGTVDGHNPGLMRIQWPNAASQDSMVWQASGVADRLLSLGYASGSDHVTTSLTASPDQWTLTIRPGQRVHYAAASASLGSVDTFGSWRGAGFLFHADAPSQELLGTVEPGFSSGRLVSSSWETGLVRWAMASTGGRAMSIPDWTGDGLFVDALSGGGSVYLRLPRLLDASWSVADINRATVNVQLANAMYDRGLVQLVTDGHQTRVDLPMGLPQTFQVDLDRASDQSKVTFHSVGRKVDMQHQDTTGNALRASWLGTAPTASLTVAPTTTRPFDYTADVAGAAIQAVSWWNGGAVVVAASNVPNLLRLVTSGTIPDVGEFSTLGTGAVGGIQALIVPNAQGTVNRVNPSLRHLAVETMGKTPYVSLNLAAATDATWELPNAGSAAPLKAEIRRASPEPGETWLALSGPREDLTARARYAAPTVMVQVDPRNPSPGAEPDPVRLVFSSVGAVTSTLHVTHADADGAATFTGFFNGASGTTSVAASGAEPAQISLTRDIALARAVFQAMDAGMVLRLDVQNPTPVLQAEVTRGTCGATSPFRGTISTVGTGATGALTLAMADGSRSPALPGTPQAVHALCEEGKAHVGARFQRVQDSRWALGPETCGVRTDILGSTTDVLITAAGNTIDAVMALWDGGAYGVYEATLANGLLQHLGVGQLKNLDEAFQCASGMTFLTPVQWIKTSMRQAPPDVNILLKPQPTPLGDLRDTIRIESPSQGAAQVLQVVAKVESVKQHGHFKDQLDYRMPANVLDVKVLDKPMMRTGLGLATDRIAAVLNDGFDYHNHFTNLQKFHGFVDHGACGGDDDIHVREFTRSSGPDREVSFWMDFGYECDKIRFDVNPYPSGVQYDIVWKSVCDIDMSANLPKAINSLKIWRSAMAVCPFEALPVRPGPLFAWTIEVGGTPAGRLDIEVKFGATGRILMTSTGGPIPIVNVGVSPGRGQDWYLAFGASNVWLKAEWDLDGDTRFSGNPVFFFGNTNGGTIGLGYRIRAGSVGLGLDAVGIRMNDLQLGTKTVSTLGVEHPWFWSTGSAGFVARPSIQFMFPSDRWHVVPLKLVGL